MTIGDEKKRAMRHGSRRERRWSTRPKSIGKEKLTRIEPPHDLRLLALQKLKATANHEHEARHRGILFGHDLAWANHAYVKTPNELVARLVIQLRQGAKRQPNTSMELVG